MGGLSYNEVMQGRERDRQIRQASAKSEKALEGAQKACRLSQVALDSLNDTATEINGRLSQLESDFETFTRETATIHSIIALALAGTWKERMQMRRVLRKEMGWLIDAARERIDRSI